MPDHRAQNEKVLEQFTQQAAPYAQLTGSGQSTLAPPFLVAVAPTDTDRVLDVACGVGRLTLMLAKMTKHATGIDLTAAMIDQARALQAGTGIENIDWRVGDILPLPFPDGAFSLVVSQAAFHHLADPGAVLAEMARVCTRDGRIAINDLSPSRQAAEALNNAEKLRDPSHVRARSSWELRALGNAIGLVETVVSSYHTAKIPLEAVLATSFPLPGDLEKVRLLYFAAARSGADTLGLKAELLDDQITIQYPMTMIVWRRPILPASPYGKLDIQSISSPPGVPRHE